MKKSKKGKDILAYMILFISLCMILYGGMELYQIGKGYAEGRKEYETVKENVVEDSRMEGEKDVFYVNFEELLSINPDTVGWIRFHPGPEQINYPVVQGTDNSHYLEQTFFNNTNAAGAIFMNAYNEPDFGDENTVIYGHRMNDSSMFHGLLDYESREFWEGNQYFYIYTPDRIERTYRIYSAGIVNKYSDTYMTVFASEEEYQKFLDMTKEVAAYDTGIGVNIKDKIVTLSTCTKAGDSNRMTVRGVLVSERTMEGR